MAIGGVLPTQYTLRELEGVAIGGVLPTQYTLRELEGVAIRGVLLTQYTLRELEGVAIGGVEGLGNVPHQFQVLNLVMPYWDVGCTEENNG